MHNVAPAKTDRSCRQVMYALGSVAKKQSQTLQLLHPPEASTGEVRGSNLRPNWLRGESPYPPSLTIFYTF